MLDKYRRQFFLKYEVEKFILKSSQKNRYLANTFTSSTHFKLSLLPRISSFTKHRNRCIRSGRKHNILTKVAYSRFFFRQEAYVGALPGISRPSI